MDHSLPITTLCFYRSTAGKLPSILPPSINVPLFTLTNVNTNIHLGTNFSFTLTITFILFIVSTYSYYHFYFICSEYILLILVCTLYLQCVLCLFRRKFIGSPSLGSMSFPYSTLHLHFIICR